MRIVIEITHPAHVHFFRNPINILKQQGHKVLVTSRDKDCTLDLLDQYGIDNICLSSSQTRGTGNLIKELVVRNRELYKVLKRFNAHKVAAVGGTCAAHAGLAARCKSFIFYDTEEARLQNFITYPLASKVFVPDCYTGRTPKSRTLRYNGYHELSYLHPNWFTPSKAEALEIGLASNRDTFLLRIVSWRASHDRGLQGWTRETITKTVEFLERKGKVLISSETNLPSGLESRRFDGPAAKIHHLLAYCRLVIGESATMASEAVVLGTPAVYAAPSYRGYISDQQRRYGMAHYVPVPTFEAISEQINIFLDKPTSFFATRHSRLISSSIEMPTFVANCITESAGP